MDKHSYIESRFGILDFPCGVHRLPNGNTLVADGGDEQQEGSEILEIDQNGQVVWNCRAGLRFAHSAEPTDDGTILVADTTNNRIVRIDRSGHITFSSDEWSNGTGKLSDGTHLDYPNDAHALPSGNYLITDRNNDRCLEVDSAGKVVWEYREGVKRPHNADPLPNGNVLIADSDHNRVIEVDSQGNQVWSYGDNDESDSLNWPRDADRLSNGNTLIADSKNSRVIEVTSAGKVVWSFQLPYFANIYEADALENGNVLISDQQHQRLLEVDRHGNIQWMFRNYRYALPIHDKLTNGSFKRWDEDGNPEGWLLFTRTAEGGGKLLKGEDESGKPHAGVEMDRPGGVCLLQLTAVKPKRRYRLGAQLKAESLAQGSVACLQFAFRDQYGGLSEAVFDSPKGQLLNEPTDWIDDSLEAVAPDSATSVEIRVLLTGPGTVWVRRVMMLAM